ncbi:MAG TPA: rhomboid family intramembrane serine protease [Myxococcaceae bacterium]|nr:rhomboid family intramembrane serine protease [Myxococcaceae bacterium]
MFLFPVGVDEATVDRVPWVSIVLAAICAVCFGVTWLTPEKPLGYSDADAQAVIKYWAQHPYLELREPYRKRILPPDVRLLVQVRRRAELEQKHKLPDEFGMQVEQGELDRLQNELLQAADQSLLSRFSLIPERGPTQFGWLTYMFLHFGWMHLLMNLFFFYLVGPMLEDVWGRPLFAAFYLGGGLAAGVAHHLLDPTSAIPMAGASGAVAACIGAFTYRYARRKINMVYWLLLFVRGSFKIPAWVWGLFWFASEVASFLLNGGDNGVAVMAHIGGFVFGIFVALALGKSGAEARYLAPVLAAKVSWEQHPDVLVATDALERGDRDTALAAFGRALDAQPDNRDALVGFSRLSLELGHREQGMAQASRLLERQLRAKDPDAVWMTLEEVGHLLDPSLLDPVLARKVADASARMPEGVLPKLVPVLVAAGALPGEDGAKPLLRAAQILLDPLIRPEPETALLYLREAEKRSDLSPELRSILTHWAGKAEQEIASRQAAREPARGAYGTVDDSLPELGDGTPRITTCKVVGLSPQALTLQASDGQMSTVELARILAVAVGVAPVSATEGAPPQRFALTDLVISWGEAGQGPTVLRLPSYALNLRASYPGVPPKEAFGQFLRHLLDVSGATALPDPEALSRGAYAHYPDEQAMNQALYGGA